MAEIRFESNEAVLGRTVVARLKRDTDLVSGIIEVCRANGLEMASVDVAIGSLRSATMCWVVPENNKRGARRSDPVRIEGPLEFIVGQGLVCLTGDKPLVHFHGTVTDPSGKSWSGHIFPGGNPVHVTADIVIRELKGVTMKTIYEEELDVDVVVTAPAEG